MTRARDVVVAAVALVLLWPLLVVLGLLVRLDSPGPALYRQERVGRDGRTFRIHKFRSMQVEPAGPQLTVGDDDPRVTRVGRWLRVSKLDELPQLLDVLRGEMSLVGPRPEVPRYVALWPQDRREVILSVRPGITDPATVLLRSEAAILAAAADPERTYVEELLPRKTKAYVDYVTNRSFLGDLAIIAATLREVVRPTTRATVPEELG